ncbi:hypothetical protein [Roseovarius sp.]|uniref:hypothetical protein n=1 Tax=Roseovarius sp. TaxID=1486281 RepID=UPI003B5914BB
MRNSAFSFGFSRPHPPHAVAEAYVATRLAGERGRTTGAIGAVDTDTILSRL